MLAQDVPEILAGRECPGFGDPAWTVAPAKGGRQAAIISTAGLMHRGDRPFGLGAADYRIIDRDDPTDLVITHISTNFDRSGFVQDREVMFPLDGLQEMVKQGHIDAVARFHYSFMGATDPTAMQPAAAQLARTLRGEGTNVVLLTPV